MFLCAGVHGRAERGRGDFQRGGHGPRDGEGWAPERSLLAAFDLSKHWQMHYTPPHS